MDSGFERRQHERRPLDESVFCHIDGSRLHARSCDVSLGGMFLRTTRHDQIPLGALVAVVFKGPLDPTQTVFLFARAVRQQTTPVPGIGLTFEKAVATGAEDGLALFLKRMFGLQSPALRTVEGDRGPKRCIFTFEPVREAPAAPPARAAPRPAASPPSPAAEVDVKTMRTPVNTPAEIEFEGDESQGTIRKVGVTGMLLESGRVPKQIGTTVNVRFTVATREGSKPIGCAGRLASWEQGGSPPRYLLDLEIVEWDEGRNIGLVKRYLKWLYVRNLANV